MKGKKCQVGCTCKRHQPRSEDVRDRISRSLKGKNLGVANGRPTDGRSITAQGYVMLSGMYDHPLATKGRGEVLEHRFRLYEKIGPGPHPCYICGKSLEWGGSGGIVVDHLNEDTRDNRHENLEPCCLHCNGRRGKPARTRAAKYTPGTPESRAYNAERQRAWRNRIRQSKLG